jgi:hypothetical protein
MRGNIARAPPGGRPEVRPLELRRPVRAAPVRGLHRAAGAQPDALEAAAGAAPRRPPPGAPATGRTTTGRHPQRVRTVPGAAARRRCASDELERRLSDSPRARAPGGGGSGSARATAPTAGGAAPGCPRRARSAAATPSRGPRPPASAAQYRRRSRPRGKFVSADRDDGLLSTPLDPAAIGMLGPKRAPAPVRTTPFARSAGAPGRTPGVRCSPPASGRRACEPSPPIPTPSATPSIWHQVLGEPRARRPLGGRPSTLRSR